MTPQPPPPGYRWEPGYQAYYHNPGCKYHGTKVRLHFTDPYDDTQGWHVDIVDPEPGKCDSMAVDEKNLWVYA